ncbi:deoxynucleoside kinase [Limosilactobacillus agrestimuris]|uniref:deoxynucleoside kinase n=1 Tax=Limosilactobacillus agrestimuris TaxID=2941331 RepID=UPI00203E9770|nr:deoxynucleoside kinase [Limosilactobacillus agrestimuris]
MIEILITMAGIIGAGKSSLTEILAKELGSTPYFEPVKDNPVLPLFYKGNEIAARKRKEGNKDATNPYAFLLQIYFLNKRFAMIKKAMQDDNNVLDRSIYEDAIFMKMNADEGNATPIEWNVYESLLDNMMEELPYAAHKKRPDLMVMIDVSYQTMINRIKKRGRKFEQVEVDPSLEQYYKKLLRYYADWRDNYDQSDLLVVNGDKYDFIGNRDDRNIVLDDIEERLVELGHLSTEEYLKIKSRRE